MRTTLLAFFSVLAIGISAQTAHRFADSTAQWNLLVDYGNPPLNHYYQTEKYQVYHDTVIGTLSYQIIKSPYPYSFLRRDSINRIYDYSHYYTKDFLLYDFSKTTGDTISGLMFDSILVVVDSVDSVNIGRSRKRMFVRYGWDRQSLQFPSIWIDGIGAINDNFLLPGSGAHIADREPAFVLCYFENGLQLYHNPIFPDCEADTIFMSSTKSLNNNNYNIQIYPNPVTGKTITIRSEIPVPQQSTFQLFDLTGRMILQQPLTDKTTQIQLHDVSQGMYLYYIHTYGQKLASGKLLVE